MIGPRPPRLRRVEPAGDPELGQILAFARDRTAAQRQRMMAAGLGVGGPGVAAPTSGPATRAVRPPLAGLSELLADRPAPAAGSSSPAPAKPASTTASRTVASGAPGTLLERTDVSPSVALFRVARPGGLRFQAGQAIKVGVGGVTRSFTIASAPDAPDLELCIERVAGGALTSKLWSLAPGARLEVAASAKGSLLFDASATAHLMIATVTGIAPFMSMLRQVLPRAPQTRVILIHGARSEEDLVYRAEVEGLAAKHPGFEVRHAVTQPGAGWTGRVGRVTEHVDEGLRALGTTGRITTYACGNPAMVRDVTARMKALGLPIRTEEFFT